MDLGLRGRRAAVAASSTGLGRCVAAALAAAGVQVAICGRDRQRLFSAAESLGRGVEPVLADVSTVGGAEGFVVTAEQVLGGSLDILVANGGGPPPSSFADTRIPAYREALEANLLAVVSMCGAAVPAMVDRGWGRVVAITSISVRQPIPNLMLSNTARAGLTGFLKTLATEVASSGVTVNSVQPGYHATDRLSGLGSQELSKALEEIPARRLGSPQDFGAVVAFLCSEQAGYLTGVSLPVDGGISRGLQ
jgi:3-oxoacyl-[acyl-carrier protein] reductase